MTKKTGIIGLLALMFVGSGWSQQTNKYRGEYANFYRAEELFEKEQYGAAKEVFREFLDVFQDPEDPQYIKARYYEGMSALALYNSDAIKLLMEFNNDYPESIYKNGIYFQLGEHFYQRKKYDDANEWFKQTDPSQLDSVDFHAFHFKKGYAHFQLEENSEAKSHFYDIKDGSSSYSAPALYYYSYISYIDKSYQEALRGFLKLEDNPAFAKEVPYYITQIYYLLGDYEKVTEYIPNYNAESGKNIADNPAEMNLLVGDAYYRIGDYEQAVPYLEDYDKKKQTTREEDYALGYAYYKSQDYDKAIRIFDRVSRTKDKLGQTSFYHIAESYVKKGEKNYARLAFRSAAELDFDLKVKEDALYNYAVLSYELDYDPYNEAIQSFELFLSEFPESDRKENVYSYMVDVYSNTKNYEEALKSIERIPNLNVQLKTAYQIVSYNMGIDSYERSNYNKAIKAFENVSKYNVSPEIMARAKFWEADAYYMQARWGDAIRKYKEFQVLPGFNDQSLKENALYNIAYAYFNQKDWPQAIHYFRAFTDDSQIKDSDKMADAYNRLGDAYYVKDDYDLQKSMLSYKNALKYNAETKDRTLYSLSKVYELMSNTRQEQISTLNEIISNYPKSPYVKSAIFDIALSYKNIGDYPNALTSFNRVIDNYPNNIIVKDALIEIADLKFKQGRYLDAESYFKRVLTEYSLDDITCKRITKGLIDVYRQLKQQEKIVELGEKYACAGITEDDNEVYYYETAISLYVNEKYNEAIPEIEKYLNHYPNGRFSIQLLSYLGEIYDKKGDKKKALSYYEQIISKPNSDYKENALVYAARELYNNKEYSRAYPYYKELESLAKTPQVVFNSRLGLMRTSFMLENYVESAAVAQRLIADKLLEDNKLKSEVNYAGGMSNYYLEKYNEAIPFLLWTERNSGGTDYINTLYYLSKSYFQLKDLKESEKYHNLIMQKASNDDFEKIGRSLILQSRIFIIKDDLFQAEQTIKMVVDNYPGPAEDGVMFEAEQVYAEIMQLKNAPKDLENELDREIDLNEGNDE
ncbi:MAG: tetratricopeptide repeat protein [Brumimicrobium sp.]